MNHSFFECISFSIQLYFLSLRIGASLDFFYSRRKEFLLFPLRVSDTVSALFVLKSPYPTVEIALTQNYTVIIKKLQFFFSQKHQACYYEALGLQPYVFPINCQMKREDLLFISIFIKLCELIRNIFRGCYRHSFENGII